MRFLVVDDSITVRRILANALQEIGCEEVREATDGKQALEMCQDIDVLITAWNMPVMSGLDLVRQIRANPATAKIRIILATSRNSRDDVQQAAEAGVDGYILKPFAQDSLRAKLDEVLNPDRPASAA
ncbi:MAG: response regulator [Gemmatimonadales bacterium]